jgi:hypothetical protein
MKLQNLHRTVSGLGVVVGLGFSLCFDVASLAAHSSNSANPSQPSAPTNSLQKSQPPKGSQKTPSRFPASIPVQPTVSSGPEIKERAYFTIKKENQRYFLKWVTKDPRYLLNPRVPLFIQLITQHPVQITPAYITPENWPKTGDRLELAIKGATAKTDNRLLGKASYSYCHTSTQQCTQALLPIVYQIQP